VAVDFAWQTGAVAEFVAAVLAGLLAAFAVARSARSRGAAAG